MAGGKAVRVDTLESGLGPRTEGPRSVTLARLLSSFGKARAPRLTALYRQEVERRLLQQQTERFSEAVQGYPELASSSKWFVQIADSLAAPVPLAARLARPQKNWSKANILNDTVRFYTGQGLSQPFEDNDTISQSFWRIERLLHRNNPGLQICVVNADTQKWQDKYSFLYSTLLILRQKTDEAGRVSQVLLASLLRTFWAADWLEKEMISLLLLRAKVPHRPLQPETLLSDRGKTIMPLSPLEVLQYPQCPEPLNWNEAFYLELHWLRDIPVVYSDVDVYVWQPLNMRPAFDHVQVMCLSNYGPVIRDDIERKTRDHRDLIILASSTAVYDRLVTNNIVFPDGVRIWPVGTNAQLFDVFSGIFNLICLDLAHFSMKISSMIEMINLRGRRNPSNWKIQLLNHLRECVLELAQNCDRSVDTLTSLIHAVQMPLIENSQDTHMYECLRELWICHNDIIAVASELRRQAEKIAPVKETIKEQMEAAQSYRNIVIGLLVALYVPLAFATSLFGMNIADGSNNTFWTNTTTMTRSHSSASNATAANATQDIQITTNQPGTKTWSWGWFWATAVLLPVATIIIPLLAGPTFRNIAQFSWKHKNWWKLIVAVLALCTFAVINYISNVSPIPSFILSILEGLAIFGLCGWHLWVCYSLGLGWVPTSSWTLILVLGVFNLPFIGTPFIFGLIGGALGLLSWVVVLVLWVAKPMYFYSPRRYSGRLAQSQGGMR